MDKEEPPTYNTPYVWIFRYQSRTLWPIKVILKKKTFKPEDFIFYSIE